MKESFIIPSKQAKNFDIAVNVYYNSNDTEYESLIHWITENTQLITSTTVGLNYNDVFMITPDAENFRDDTPKIKVLHRNRNRISLEIMWDNYDDNDRVIIISKIFLPTS